MLGLQSEFIIFVLGCIAHWRLPEEGDWLSCENKKISICYLSAGSLGKYKEI